MRNIFPEKTKSFNKTAKCNYIHKNCVKMKSWILTMTTMRISIYMFFRKWHYFAFPLTVSHKLLWYNNIHRKTEIFRLYITISVRSHIKMELWCKFNKRSFSYMVHKTSDIAGNIIYSTAISLQREHCCLIIRSNFKYISSNKQKTNSKH